LSQNLGEKADFRKLGICVTIGSCWVRFWGKKNLRVGSNILDPCLSLKLTQHTSTMQHYSQLVNQQLSPLVSASVSLSHKRNRVTMTTEKNSKYGATTLSCMNFSGYVGHATLFSW